MDKRSSKRKHDVKINKGKPFGKRVFRQVVCTQGMTNGVVGGLALKECIEKSVMIAFLGIPLAPLPF